MHEDCVLVFVSANKATVSIVHVSGKSPLVADK